MTYRAEIVSKMERCAELWRDVAPEQPNAEQTERYLDAAKALDSLAAQFTAGDYDANLMNEYAALTEDADRALDLSKAADEVLSEIGFEDGYLTPDDVLDEILVRAGR